MKNFTKGKNFVQVDNVNKRYGGGFASWQVDFRWLLAGTDVDRLSNKVVVWLEALKSVIHYFTNTLRR